MWNDHRLKALCIVLAVVLSGFLLYEQVHDRQESAQYSAAILATYQSRTQPAPALDYTEYVRDIIRDARVVQEQAAERKFQLDLAGRR